MPSQSDQILELIALSGEFPAAALRRLPNKESYRYKLMAYLKEKKLIKLYTHDGLRGYKLTAKAREMLMSRNLKRFEFFLTGNAETNKRLFDIKRRLRLHSIAEVTVTLSNVGVVIFLDEKPALFAASPAAFPQPSGATFYYSREMKSIEDEQLKIRSSRAAGVIFTEEEMLLTYNTGGSIMKWENQTELRCKVFLTSRFCRDETTAIYSDTNISGLMTGANMDMALALLTSVGGYRKQFFRLDGTFDRFYYAPNTTEGETQIKILCSNSTRKELSNLLLSDLAPKNPGLHAEHDALTHEGLPVLLAFDFDMERLRRFHGALGLFGRNGIVYCFDFQKPPLEKYLGTLAEFRTIDRQKTERRFFGS